VKRRESLLIACLVAMCALLVGRVTYAVEAFRGSFTLAASGEPGKIEFTMSHTQHGHSTVHGSAVPVGTLVGLDLSNPSAHDAKFTLTRDAGQVVCEGHVENRQGGGVFSFFANPKFSADMSSLGFTRIDEEKQFSMLGVDVTLAFAREMRGADLRGLDSDTLTALRVHGVDAAFVRGFRDAGVEAKDCDKLIALRIQGATPEMARFLVKTGYRPTEDDLVNLRIHGATPEWIQELQTLGYRGVPMDGLIAFRIHGVSPEFIRRIQALGYSHPQPDELVAMRIHGVTPEYITMLRSKGMHDLTIDQLVSLRIQGVD
jgi:hypothetical protein